MEDGAADFDMTLRILIAGVRTLDSRPAGHPRLGADEARLLRLFGALQHGDTGAAAAILQGWLPSKPLRWLMRYARSFVGVMASQRLILPTECPRTDRTLRYAPALVRFWIVGPCCCIRPEISASAEPDRIAYIMLIFSKIPSVEGKTNFILSD